MTNLSGANFNNGAADDPKGEGRDSPSIFPAYPAYNDSGIDWLGDVPEHWSVLPVKWVGWLKGGAGFPHDKQGVNSYELDFHKVNALAAADSEGVLRSSENTITRETAKELGAYVFPEGTIVFAKVGAALLLGRLRTISAESCIDNNMMGLIVFQGKVSNQFALYSMGTVRFDLIANPGAVPSLNEGQIGNYRLAIPSLLEQTQIARFLDHETARIDALIEEQQRLIELLKEKRQAVISHAVTKGLDPTMPMKDSGAEWLGEVPAHWETLRIGAVYSEAADKGLAELPVLRVSIHHGVSDKELSEEESDRKITRIDDREKYKRVRPGDLVYNMMRAWQGGFGAVLVDGLVSPAYVVARPKNEDISRYVEQLLRTGCAVEEMRKNSYGITDFRLRLYWDQFKNIVIVIPPEVERQQIMERIDSLINESEALKSEADRLIVILQERRSALISAAVTGKIDVRGWQPPARAQAPVLEAEAV